MAFLEREACDEIQGYLVDRPAPIAQYSALTGSKATGRSLALAG
jgi:EAL domain-containing protein (putative c-di-GMP-specific phosphodiesterase class I)